MGGSQAHLVIHATLTVTLWIRERERSELAPFILPGVRGYRVQVGISSYISARRDNVKG